MADKSINQLPVSAGLTDDGLLVVYQNNITQSIRGNLIKQFAEQGIEAALADAKASGEFDGKDGYTPVKGKDYTDGEDGKDGVSPTITVTNITGGHRLTITDATGTKTVDVMDGEDGANGMGSGDMLASEYDPQGKRQDVFAYVDNAVKNAVSTDDIDAAVSEALEEAKASGEFDGKDGQDGADGHTPVKGVDYWTDADKAQMVNDVIAALPDASEVSY